MGGHIALTGNTNGGAGVPNSTNNALFRRHEMASRPAPDTIVPQSPPEVPAEPNPIEAPQQQPDEAPLTEPDIVQPGNTPPEVPQG